MVARLTAERSETLPVIDAHGRLLGVVAASDAERALEEEHDRFSASTLARNTPELRADETLEDAVHTLAVSDEDGLPVLAVSGEQVVGWLTHQQLLRAYRDRLSTAPSPAHSI